MEKTTKLAAVLASLFAGALVLHFTGYLDLLLQLFGDPQYLKETLEPYGFYAAFVLIGLLLVNNILWVIPGHGLGVACGLMYGVYWGTFVCMIGTTLSTLLAVFISKRYGRPAVKSVIGKEKLEEYEHFTEATDVWPFIILILLPVVPDDATVYLAGLTDFSIKRLVIVLSLARLPGVITLTWFGEGVATADYTVISIISVFILLVSVGAIWKRKHIMDGMENSFLQED